MERVIFITTGATAPFPELVAKALSPECLAEFEKEGFTKVYLQCGDVLAEFQKGTYIPPQGTCRLSVEAFDFKNSLHDDMRLCQAKEGVRKQGLIIMHAGAGTVMDAMRLGLAMIVVANPALLDNHQDELAQELEDQNYATRSDVDGLAKAIRVALMKQSKPWAPQHATVKNIIDDVVGYQADVSSRLVLD
ncbi:related to ALG13 Essential protein required for the second step of dolichyl-linked oligosaccharide synthesis [Phialocephala subalpina]|uniref:UDP-N-acetylglucosamine transferase subunit ALG13 n=1 Tax=Phialocephala subalpina TaxID=576137 RepID=A0A1L7X5Q7_9HELO|nr:related to ALG13 Essential protein required for the second step of dolichyl-linked oligosaccharide synthesis [Phialocephala subalpina]